MLTRKNYQFKTAYNNKYNKKHSLQFIFPYDMQTNIWGRLESLLSLG